MRYSGTLEKAEIIAAMKKIPAVPGSPPIENDRTAATEARLEAAVNQMVEAADTDVRDLCGQSCQTQHLLLVGTLLIIVDIVFGHLAVSA